ncbi:hypothetical protein CR983_03795 [Candidatus Saccharibacteria bacterium]|nr:MAG: hypothetical protein CR983_03795 [Candidatus Saccharibacteria bacterium]
MAKKHPTYKHAWYAVALARIMMGFVFLWAFLDKTFGLGFATEPSGAWINGGSPTTSFLKHGANPESPFADFIAGLIGMAWADWLFMIGLLGIGLALVLGIGLRIAAVTGSLLLIMMWMALLPLEYNPFVDDHIIYAVVLWAFVLGRREWSLADWWLSQSFVKKNQWLW